MSDHTPTRAERHVHKGNCRRDGWIRRTAWVGLFLFSVFGLFMMVRSGIKGREYVRCTVNQSTIMIQYLRESALAGAEERRAHDGVRRAQRDGDQQAQNAAIDEYFKIRAQSDARRAASQLPQLPETVCGSEY